MEQINKIPGHEDDEPGRILAGDKYSQSPLSYLSLSPTPISVTPTLEGLSSRSNAHVWADQWIPASVWRLLADETNVYWKQKKEAKQEENGKKKVDPIDDAMDLFGMASPYRFKS